jgi:hypothetical protein
LLTPTQRVKMVENAANLVIRMRNSKHKNLAD